MAVSEKLNLKHKVNKTRSPLSRSPLLVFCYTRYFIKPSPTSEAEIIILFTVEETKVRQIKSHTGLKVTQPV